LYKWKHAPGKLTWEGHAADTIHTQRKAGTPRLLPTAGYLFYIALIALSTGYSPAICFLPAQAPAALPYRFEVQRGFMTV
jgi:hypothetical protein